MCRLTFTVFKQGRVCLAGAPDSNNKGLNGVSDIVGHSNECRVSVNEQLFNSLLDTGANVSTICHGAFVNAFPNIEVKPLKDFHLDIECAGDQKLPYSGYVAVDIGVPGVVDPVCCLLLVTPDTRYSQKVPIILGTNVLKPLMDATEQQHGTRFQQKVKMPDALYFTFRCMKLQNRLQNRSSGRLAVVKCAVARKIVIPENTTMVIEGKFDKKQFTSGEIGIMQPIQQSALPDGVCITPTLVDSCQDSVPVELSNLTTRPIVIVSDSILCQVQSCQLESDSPDFQESYPSSTSCSSSIVDLGPSKLSDPELLLAQKLINDYDDVFSKDDMDVGLTSMVKHRIRLDDSQPFKQRFRKIPPSMFAEVQKHIQQLLDSDIIRHSQSPWASNVVLVKKKDGSLRICVDYRQLNLRTVKDAYALPRIDDLLEGLGGNVFYSVLDMRKGYHQVDIQEDDKPLTAFTVGPLGFYEYNRLPLGLSNAPATYQRLMEQIFQEFITSKDRFCQIYLDDIIVVSKSFEEHLDHLNKVFSKIKTAGMKLSPNKCHLFRDKVRYVGHVVSSKGIEADPDKVERVRNWPVPKDADEVRTFLGFTGYYRRFVKDYAKIARPLNELSQEVVGKRKCRRRKPPEQVSRSVASFDWQTGQQEAFDKLKQCLTTPPILVYPDYSKPFVLHTDACMMGLGAVLYQEVDGKEHAIAYASRGLSKAERNYPVHKLEFLALKWAITKKFSDYLYGNQFVVFTDNNPLTYVLQKAKLDATGHRWIAALSSYDFKIKYRCGKSNSDADGLSRMPHDDSSDADRSLIPMETIQAWCQGHFAQPYIESLCMSTTHVDEEIDLQGDILPQDWRPRQRDDPIIGTFVRAVTNKTKPTAGQITSKEGKTLLREFHKLMVKRGVLYRSLNDNGEKKCQLVLPGAFREQAIRCAHDEMGHLGRERTINVLRDRVYWPNMTSDVQDWVRACTRCMHRKSPTNHRAPLVSIVTTQPLELVCMDYLTLETSKGGYQHILVITDHFTKFSTAIPTRNQTAKTTAEALFNGFMVFYGLPQRLHSDQGANFQSNIIQELCKLTGVQKSRTTPYHAMGNGIVERFNQTLLNMLGTLEPAQKLDWKSAVAPLVHAYNCTRHDSTHFTPYELMFGRKPRLAIDAVLGLVNDRQESEEYTDYVLGLKERIAVAYDLASRASRSAQASQKSHYDKKQRGAVVRPQDRVLVKIVAFDGKHKISDRWEHDIYVVQEQPNQEVPVYIVKREDGEGATRTLHRNLLLPISALPLADIVVDVDSVQDADIALAHDLHTSSIPTDDTSDTCSSSSSDNDDYLVVEQNDSIMYDAKPTVLEQVTLDVQGAPKGDLVPVVEVDGGTTIITDSVADTVVQPAQQRPIPAPRRSQRKRTQPSWMTSGEFVCAQVAQVNEPTDNTSVLHHLIDLQIDFQKTLIDSLKPH